MTIPLTFLNRYAVPLLLGILYLGNVDIPQQFEIFDRTQRLADEVLSKARGEGELKNGLPETFDYIIVGGGSAGAVVANKLTESGVYRVLLLEAGGDPNPIMDVPYAQRFYWEQGNWMDWGYSVVQQNNSCGNRNRYCVWPRGKALGGSSAVNGLVYNRCKPRDYDNWAEFTGDSSWSWENVRETYNKLEDYHGFYEDSAGNGSHGAGGPVYVGKIDHIPGVEVVEEAFREKGIPLGDLNAGENMTFGFSRIDYNIKQGLRWGAYQAFLEPILNRSNLVIYRYAYAFHVDWDADIDGEIIAVGVTYKRHGKVFSARAYKEVILSTGVIESPKLLMLTGIGPRDHLESLGIHTLIDLPVGKYLQDHPGIPIHGKNGGFRVNRTFGVEHNTTGALLEFLQNGTGPLNGFAYWGEYATQVMTGYLSSKLNGDDKASPDVHLYVLERFTPNENNSIELEGGGNDGGGGTERFWFSVELDRVSSTGSVRLASSDPEDKPVIDPNFLANPEESERLIDVIEIMMDVFLNSTTFQRLGIQPLDPYDDLCTEYPFASREFWKCYIRHQSTPFIHPTSTCRMGPNSTVAVVDSNLKVFGTRNVRVVDASVMPFVPSGNTHLPAILIGARGAEIILAEQQLEANPTNT